MLAALAINADAEESSNISEVVSNVAKAILPARSYWATVHQRVSVANGNATFTNPTPAQSQSIEETDYLVAGEPSGALRATKGLALKRAIQPHAGNAGASAPDQNLRLMVAVNPMNALRHIEKLGSGVVTNDLYQSIACYKISATDGQFTFLVWVSKSDSSVRRQVILQDTDTLLDTEFTYQEWNGALVPSHVVISKPSNGTRIDQVFTGHTY